MKPRLLALAIAVFVLTVFTPAVTQTTSAAKNAASSKSASQPAPSASEIAAARAERKVWVNLDTGIYHRGGRWYGKTKSGKFMTLDEAKKAGYKAAKRD